MKSYRWAGSCFSTVGCGYAVIAAFLLAGTTVQAQDAVPSDRRYALTIERFASLGFSYGRADAADDQGVDFTAFVLGGTQANPLGAPRAGFDFITSGNFVVGGILGVTAQSLTIQLNSSSDASSSLSLWALLFGGRVGYRVQLGRIVDIVPRLGFTLLTGALTFPGNRSCSENFDPVTGAFIVRNCTNSDGPTGSLLAGIATLDVVGRVHLTPGFFLDGGLAYDQPLFANLDVDDFAPSPRTSGTYLHLQLWFGLGGYLY